MCLFNSTSSSTWWCVLYMCWWQCSGWSCLRATGGICSGSSSGSEESFSLACWRKLFTTLNPKTSDTTACLVWDHKWYFSWTYGVAFDCKLPYCSSRGGGLCWGALRHQEDSGQGAGHHRQSGIWHCQVSSLLLLALFGFSGKKIKNKKYFYTTLMRNISHK